MSFPIFEKLGGEKVALKLVEQARGKPLTDSALRKWRNQGQIPSHRQLLFIAEAIRLNVPYTLDDFKYSGEDRAA